VFWTQLGRFTYLAFAYIIIAVYKFYLTQLLEMRWRSWMTGHYLRRWLSAHAFYKMELARFTRPQNAEARRPDNPDQRIQEDLNLFTSYTIGLVAWACSIPCHAGQFCRHPVGTVWRVSFSFGGMLQHPRLHGLDGGPVLRGRQCADALHRAPADQAEF
jgi:putative ATP-binding cassette transporter